MFKYDNIVIIGRWQPVHNGHVKILNKATELSQNIIVVVGSINQPRTYKNPFSFQERVDLIKSCIRIDDLHTFKFVGVEDNLYNEDSWIKNIQEQVKEQSVPGSTALLGHYKDESSYYLNLFPQWEFIDSGNVDILNASDIRDLYFSDKTLNYITNVVSKPVLKFLTTFRETNEYKQIVKERQFIELYKKQFEHLAYPPVFVTADTVVIQAGHVLLVKRKSEPGKGLWALPGGFLNAKTDKSILDAAIRELVEETKIKVPEKVLRGNIEKSKVFDAINRSARGRTITTAFKIHLPSDHGEQLPKVKGSDDALVASWVPIGNLDGSKMFEDHYFIIQWAIGK